MRRRPGGSCQEAPLPIDPALGGLGGVDESGDCRADLGARGGRAAAACARAGACAAACACGLLAREGAGAVARAVAAVGGLVLGAVALVVALDLRGLLELLEAGVPLLVGELPGL